MEALNQLEQLANVPLDKETIDGSIALLISWGMRLLSATLILIAGWVIGNRVSNAISKIKRLDSTLKSFLGGLVKYFILAVALITVLGQFGVQTASLLAVLGAAGLAIGLALQGTLSNVASGVMLLILRPFNVGDYIEAGGIGATVTDLGLFTTELATPDNVYVAVPNSKIWNSEIKNYSRNLHRRQDILVGISYNDDINKAIKCINKVLSKEDRLIRTEGKEPQVMTSGMGDFSIDMIVRIWCTRNDYWDLKWDLTKAIKEALDKDGITIPFPTRTIEYANGPEAVKKAGTGNVKSTKKKAA